uniref:7TM_GPCR_Srx domain-containing protein n=1 Tax=Rhabditophanes sp. KR3021 TaxID=114890 RepID=A0AC35TMI0_9BILA
MNLVTILDITHIVILCLSIVFYLFCIYSIFKSPSLHNSFGYIFLILCVGAILQSLISIIYQNLYDYVFPSIISYKNITIASFDNLLIKIIANCHLFLVINRLISLFFPIFYHHWFTKSTSFIFALFPIILGIVLSLPMIIYDNCYVFYDGKLRRFEYKRNWYCILLSKIYKNIKTKNKSQNPKFWTKENRFSCHCICLNVLFLFFNITTNLKMAYIRTPNENALVTHINQSICFILQPIIFIVSMDSWTNQ